MVAVTRSSRNEETGGSFAIGGQWDWPEGEYAAILCVGSTQAFGSFEACLRVAFDWLKPNGRLLVAEGYWKQAPAQGYDPDRRLPHALRIQDRRAYHEAGVATMSGFRQSNIHREEDANRRPTSAYQRDQSSVFGQQQDVMEFLRNLSQRPPVPAVAAGVCSRPQNAHKQG